MPLAHLTVAGDAAFDGIAYTIPIEIHQTLENNIKEHIEVLSAALDAEGKYSLLDLVHVCAGRFAAKTFDPLRLRGIIPFYPFLDSNMLQLSLSLPYATKCPQGEAKALLKQLLARTLPKEWVYRPKSGFIPPFAAMLRASCMQEFIAGVVLSADNELLSFGHERVIRRMFAATRRRQPLSHAAYGFLWNLMFASGWLYQVKRTA